MALPTGISPCTMAVEYSLEGTAWVDISDFATVVTPPRQVRTMGGTPVFGEDTYLITAGKREPLDVAMRYVYTEGTGDPFEVFRQDFEEACGGPVYIRWSPQGTATGNFSFTTSTTQTEVSEFEYPGGEVTSADPMMTEIIAHTGSITKAVRA